MPPGTPVRLPIDAILGRRVETCRTGRAAPWWPALSQTGTAPGGGRLGRSIDQGDQPVEAPRPTSGRADALGEAAVVAHDDGTCPLEDGRGTDQVDDDRVGVAGAGMADFEVRAHEPVVGCTPVGSAVEDQDALHR